MAAAVGHSDPGARVQVFEFEVPQVDAGSVDDDREGEHCHPDDVIGEPGLEDGPQEGGDSLFEGRLSLAHGGQQDF